MEPRGKITNAARIAAAIAMLAAIAMASPALAQTKRKNGCVVGDPHGPTPPRAKPRELFAKEDTQLTVTSVVPPDPDLIPGSVTLLQVDSSGNQIANLGQMYDDGTHGDSQAGDGMYTAQPTVNPPAASEIYLAVQAKYSGPLGCRRSSNNDWDIAVSNPRTTDAQDKAMLDAGRAGDAFFHGEIDKGIALAQVNHDLIEFFMSHYGPNGTVMPGVVISAVISPAGDEVIVTFSTGLQAIYMPSSADGLLGGTPVISVSRKSARSH